MARYYGDLRAEVAEQADRAEGRGSADATKFAARLEALDREEQTRSAELRQKATLRVQLRLITLVVIRQPKLLLRSAIHAPGGAVAGRIDLVWDPPGRRPGSRPLPSLRPAHVRPRNPPPGRPGLPLLPDLRDGPPDPPLRATRRRSDARIPLQRGSATQRRRSAKGVARTASRNGPLAVTRRQSRATASAR